MDPIVVLQFGIATLLPVVACVVLTLLMRRTKLGEAPYWQWQIGCGLIFGAIAIFGTEMGIDYNGATMNVRDAAPVVAGLYFGGPAGIIAGLIGGVERWFAALWGRGMFTRVGCSVATVFAGFYAALMNRFLFRQRRASWPLAMSIGMVAEVVHLLLVYLTNMDNATHAYAVVSACTVPMIACNGIAVALSGIGFSLVSGQSLLAGRGLRDIAQRMQLRMMMAVVVILVCTLVPTALIENSVSEHETKTQLELALGDVEMDLLEGQVQTAVANTHVGRNGYVALFSSTGELLGTRSDVSLAPTNAHDLLEEAMKHNEGEVFKLTLPNTSYYAMRTDLKGVHLVALLPVDEANLTRDSSVLVSVFMETIIFFALFAVIYLLIEQLVVRNIWRVNSRLGQITRGDLTVQVDVRDSVEFASLSDDINSTVGALRHAIDVEASRIDRELGYARAIQQSALPSTFPAYPSHTDFDLYASMHAAKEVGGDFYDFYLIDDDHLAFLIADVSGKGIPAALFMMRAKTAFKSLIDKGYDVGEVFSQVNAMLCEGNDTDMFVTAWMGIIDLATGHVRYANAGHNPPALCHDGRSFELLTMRKNIFLAYMDGMRYAVNELRMSPGDVIFLYTDGVVEANDQNEKLYGEERLLGALDGAGECSMEQLCNTVLQSVNDYAGDTPQFDDMTMLALRYNGR